MKCSYHKIWETKSKIHPASAENTFGIRTHSGGMFSPVMSWKRCVTVWPGLTWWNWYRCRYISIHSGCSTWVSLFPLQMPEMVWGPIFAEESKPRRLFWGRWPHYSLGYCLTYWMVTWLWKHVFNFHLQVFAGWNFESAVLAPGIVPMHTKHLQPQYINNGKHQESLRNSCSEWMYWYTNVRFVEKWKKGNLGIARYLATVSGVFDVELPEHPPAEFLGSKMFTQRHQGICALLLALQRVWPLL